MKKNNKILVAKGGFLASTFREKGLKECVAKIWAAIKMSVPLFLFGRRTNKSVGAYFDLITDDGRLFYGDSFHFGYFPGDEETLSQGLDAHTDLVAQMACVQEGKQILDIGCGICDPAKRIAKKHKCHITGVNISSEQVKQGRELVAKEGLADRIDVQEGNALSLDFKDGSFDAVLCLEVAGDICVNQKQKEILVKELYRVLKPGGHVGFSDLVFKSVPTKDDERSMRTILYHEGEELITDWPTYFLKQGFVIKDQKDIIKETMKTWKHSLAVYEENTTIVEKRYGKSVAQSTMAHLRKIPIILEKHASFPVLSLYKP
ncbi:MAG: methyltransferase domain-containing protein [bacterium]|nr:methyltransferase domain-containing protein [bacterium]MBU1918310.1 methyltransferase domain-containing protein [bacterium]